MWNMLGELTSDLGGAAPGQQTALLARTFGPLQFIHLTRRDAVAQAVSRHKAEVSGTWHLGLEEAEHPVQPHYDAPAIRRYLAKATDDNRNWEAWFTTEAITPHRITYEDLSADPQATAAGVLAHLGLTPTSALHATNRRMGGRESAEWAARFRAEGV